MILSRLYVWLCIVHFWFPDDVFVLARNDELLQETTLPYGL